MFTKIFLVLVCLISLVTSDSPRECCSQNNILLRKGNRCWDPATDNKYTSILNCTKIARFAEFSIIDGNLELVIVPNYKESWVPNQYCLANSTTVFDKQLQNVTQVAALCIDEQIPPIIEDEIYGYCMMVSVIFLAVTAIVYLALPEIRDVQGKSIACFCASTAIGCLIMAIMKTTSYEEMNLCAARGFLAYFFVIAGFFWTNAISIQILINTRRPSINQYGQKEFILYSIYAWSVPSILTIAMAIVNYHPGEHQKPGIGLMHCWFFNTRQQWYYMYSVMTILLLTNIAIFVYTSVILWKHSFSSSHLKAIRYKSVMSIRLIVIMGIPWIFEMLGTIFGPHVVWTIFDLINTLQGIPIFLLLVVFRRRVIKAMHKHGWLDCIAGPIEKYLAVGDDEENVVDHTINVPLEDKPH